MPYNRARRIMSNFTPPIMPGGQFGTTLGVGQGFYSPEENWAQPTTQMGDTTQTQPPQPPGGAAPAGRTGVQQGVGEPPPSATAPQGVGFPSAPNQSFGREILRQNPNAQGVQQMGVRRPLSQARRFGI